MAYRHLKSVLGETNLERKCRLLFGTCLLLLVAGGFMWVWIPTEKLVYEKAQDTGSLLADAVMLKVHWDVWEPDDDRKRVINEMSTDLQNQNYEWEFLSLEPSQWTTVPNDPWQVQTLVELEIRQEQQLQKRAELEEQTQARAVAEAEAAGVALTEEEISAIQSIALAELPPLRPLFAEQPRDSTPGEYHYYQPVYWKGWGRSCKICHDEQRETTGALGAASAGSLDDGSPPFHVIKVVIPDRDTQSSISKNRAILIATAIVTVFVAMVALYVIVRYVVVKPLTHLRDVSDEISRGVTNKRAEINTNDEFEELAHSFNRMVIHLTDAQHELELANGQLDSKVDELAQANMQLYDMNRLKSDFLANMSHELRTPLNSILGFSDVLQGIDALNEKQQKYVNNIQTSGRMLLDMINDILDLAKMESGKVEVRPTEFNIGTVVGAHCDGLRGLSDDKNIDLAVDMQANLPPVYQDQTKIQQILMNLLSNAIKFTPEGGRITVTVTRSQQGQLEISVADTGVGIAPEDQEIVFEKFRQGSSSVGNDNLTRSHSGTGLGLSIVRELCILLGGEVTLTSELGKGSRFSVRLPWVVEEESHRDSQISAKVDDLTRPRRANSSSSNGSPLGHEDRISAAGGGS